ncbi:hypothetical protein [Streptomyces sp. NPDC049881]|uniref:hypothetical protein n=1 Tax=Streptomyces sp. NPDC049881 TaxID=3155778 RepID=UPI00343DBDE5
MKQQPRHIEIDGEPMVALTVRDFESIAAMRRQLGSQATRLRTFRMELLVLSEFLDTLDLALHENAARPAEAGHAGLPTAVARLVPDLRRHAATARRITGAKRREDARDGTPTDQANRG